LKVKDRCLEYNFQSRLNHQEMKIFKKMTGGDYSTIEKTAEAYKVKVYFIERMALTKSPAGYFTEKGFKKHEGTS